MSLYKKTYLRCLSERLPTQPNPSLHPPIYFIIQSCDPFVSLFLSLRLILSLRSLVPFTLFPFSRIDSLASGRLQAKYVRIRSSAARGLASSVRMIDGKNALSGSAMKVAAYKAFFKYFCLSSGIVRWKMATARKKNCAEIVCCLARGRYLRRAFCWERCVTKVTVLWNCKI